MAEMRFCGPLEELWLLIEQQHLLYLELDESLRKIDQRNKLEGYIKEYLCRAPHDRKYTLHYTSEVLRRSASTKDNFSGYRAAVAWKAIGKYADNLLAQPWRKEYRDIKLYCGFYKHEIEESLVGAELMFEAMGYRHAGHSTMALPDVLDPDRVSSVSKDAIMAFVECQIMKQIWEAVSPHYNFSWLEILEFRENHTGTPEQAIRALTYKYRQRQFQEQSYRNQQYPSSNIHPPRADCMYGPNVLGYYSHMHYPSHSYTLPVQSRYAPVISPQQIVPPPVVYQPPIHPSYPSHHVLKATDLYPTNGYNVHSHYSTQLNTPHVMHNGYSAPQMAYSAPSTVPTAQLIELDSTPSHNDCESHSQRPSNIQKHHGSHEETNPGRRSIPETVKNHENLVPSGKARDDGAGSWENWDYVYRNLESHGYRKDVGSRGDLLSKGNYQSSQHNSADVDIDNSALELTEKLRKVNLDSVNINKNEGSSKIPESGIKPRTEDDARSKSTTEVDSSKEVPKSMGAEIRNRTSPEKTRREPTRKSSESSSLVSITLSKVNVEPKEPESNKAQSRESTRSPELRLDEEEDDKWECITCTYLNSSSRDICEMCYKSKERGNEIKPQPSGGQECSKCTLVNEPGLTICAACSTSLKDSPTYI